MDIHNYKKQLERQLELAKKQENISQENKNKIVEFSDYLLSEGIGVAKIGRYLIDLRKFAVMLNKPFEDATEQDIRKIVASIEQGELAPESKKSFKVLIRKLYRFIKGVTEKGVYPPEVKWISIRIPKNHNKLPEEVLNEKEITLMIRSCGNLRDKTLISVLYESGCRISEIANLKIKHISFEEYGARLVVSGKTGMRKILVIQSAPFLQSWLNIHPQNNNPEAYLWISSKGNLISYTRICYLLKAISKQCGITKRIYPHLFRHSRATYLANKMSEAAMKSYFGWGADSKMCGIYIHMSGELTDEAILKASGIEIKEEKKHSLTQQQKCLRCGHMNEFSNLCCGKCGLILSKELAEEKLNEDIERQQANEIMQKLMQDKEVLELIKKKLIS